MQFLPIRVSVLHLAQGHGEHRVSRAARAVEIAATRDILARLDEDSVHPQGAEPLRALLRGSVTRDGLDSAVRECVGPQADERIHRRLVHVLWEGCQVRADRVLNDPAPWFVHELQRETKELRAVIEEKHVRSRSRIQTLEAALDGILSLTVGLAAGAGSAFFLSPMASVGIGLVAAGGMALLRAPTQDAHTEFITDEPDLPRPEEILRPTSDAMESDHLFRRYVDSLRAVHLIPVFIFEQTSALDMPAAQVSGWIRGVLGSLPAGVASLFVGQDPEVFEDIPELSGRLVVRPKFSELHSYLNRRLPIPQSLRPMARARVELERSAVRLAMLSNSQGLAADCEHMLRVGKIGGRICPPESLEDELVIRIRATLQLAYEVVLGQFRDSMAADPQCQELLPHVLRLPIRQWNDGTELDIGETVLSEWVKPALDGRRWVDLSDNVQNKLRASLSQLVELLASRTWLVSRLTEEQLAHADIIPEWSLLAKANPGWTWSFTPEGTPQRPVESNASFEAPPEPLSIAPGPIEPAFPSLSARQAVQESLIGGLPPRNDLPAPTEKQSLEAVLDRYLGDYTPARRPLETSNIPRAVQPEPQKTVPKASGPDGLTTVELLETLDEVMADILDGGLNVADLARCGVLPIMPSPESVRQALTGESSPCKQYLLYEAGTRLRERLGVLEKFLLWVSAVHTLCRQTPSVRDVAELICSARSLRGRTAAGQHAQIPMRSLKAELRDLCPSTRGISDVFQRTPTPSGTVDALLSWGQELKNRCEKLSWALRDGVPESTVALAAWSSFTNRLKKHVLHGKEEAPAFAEHVAYIDGYGPAALTGWMSGVPSLGQLSQLYLSDDAFGPQNDLWNARACASLALGLNQVGFNALGDDGESFLDDDVSTRLADSGPTRSPFVAVLGEVSGSAVSDGPGPRRGSALLAPSTAIFPADLDTFDVVFHPSDVTPSADQIPCPSVENVDELIVWAKRYF